MSSKLAAFPIEQSRDCESIAEDVGLLRFGADRLDRDFTAGGFSYFLAKQKATLEALGPFLDDLECLRPVGSPPVAFGEYVAGSAHGAMLKLGISFSHHAIHTTTFRDSYTSAPMTIEQLKACISREWKAVREGCRSFPLCSLQHVNGLRAENPDFYRDYLNRIGEVKVLIRRERLEMVSRLEKSTIGNDGLARGLDDTQVRVLEHLRHRNLALVLQADLVVAVNKSEKTVRTALAKLAESGFVEKPQGCRKGYKLTALGIEVAERLVNPDA